MIITQFIKLVFRNKKIFAFAFWIWIIAIIIFSVIPNGPKMQIDIKSNTYRLDYILHFLVYFSLAILYLLWKADKYFKVKSIALIYFFVGALILAGFSEYIQTFVPGRTFNPFDFYSNVFGVIVGIIAPKLVLK